MVNDIELFITNIFISLSKGELNDTLRSNLSYTKVAIERKLIPSSNNHSNVVADVLLFSRKFNHFFIIEIKNITTSDLDFGQAENYSKLDKQSFRDLGYPFEKDKIIWDVSYISNYDKINSLKQALSSINISFPLLVLNDKFKILSDSETKINFKKLHDIFEKGIDLQIDNLNKVHPYIHFSPKSKNSTIVTYVVTELCALILKRKENVGTEEIAKESYSEIDGIWFGLNRSYKGEITSKVNQVLFLLQQNGLSGQIININGEWNLDIYDSVGAINYGKLNKIKEKVELIKYSIDGQTSLFSNI